MIPIKFRAMYRNTSWIYGSTDLNELGGPIRSMDYFFGKIRTKILDKKTLSQFTGLYDKNGKEIYEGDIVEDTMGIKYQIVWSQCSFKKESKNEIEKLHDRSGEFITVIGNIHENPELIE